MTKGFQTSEFLVTLVSTLVGFLVASGIVAPAHATDIVNAIITIIGGILAIIPAVTYILSRTWLKSKQLPIVPTGLSAQITPVGAV